MKKIYLILAVVSMIFAKPAESCDESTWFWKKDVREKKQFMKDFIAHPDSICEPAFYEKYETFRIRAGFIEDHQEMFSDEYHRTTFFPVMKGFIWWARNGKGFIELRDTTALLHDITLGRFYKEDETDRSGIAYPKLEARWVCINDEWILTEVGFKYHYNSGSSFGIGTPKDYENW